MFKKSKFRFSCCVALIILFASRPAWRSLFRFLRHLLGNIASFSPGVNELAPRSGNSTIFAMSTSKMLAFPKEFAFQPHFPPTSTSIIKIPSCCCVFFLCRVYFIFAFIQCRCGHDMAVRDFRRCGGRLIGRRCCP